MSDMTYEELFAAAVDEALRQGIAVEDGQAPIKQTCAVNGQRLHYLDWGGADDTLPVVRLHGAWTNAHVWDFFSLQMRRHFHIYSVDLPGHGDSQWTAEGDYSRGRLARDVLGLIDALGLDELVLIGHSLGGSVATLVA